MGCGSPNSIKLDSHNKEKMHNFYDVLLKRFRRVGSQTEKGKLSFTERQDRKKQLDFLSGWVGIIGKLYWR